MPEIESNDETPLDATEVQFSTRSLLIVMAVGAVVASALGAFVRQFPVEARPRLLVFWSVLAAIMASLVVFHAWRRQAAEKKAGQVLLYVERHSYFFLRQPAWAIYLAGGLSLVIAPAMWVAISFVIATRPSSEWWRMINYGTIYSIFLSGAGITFFWWRRIRVCENGFVVRNRFLPWAECKRWYWDACTKNVLVTEINRYGALAVRVPEGSRETVEALANANIARK